MLKMIHPFSRRSKNYKTYFPFLMSLAFNICDIWSEYAFVVQTCLLFFYVQIMHMDNSNHIKNNIIRQQLNFERRMQSFAFNFKICASEFTFTINRNVQKLKFWNSMMNKYEETLGAIFFFKIDLKGIVKISLSHLYMFELEPQLKYIYLIWLWINWTKAWHLVCKLSATFNYICENNSYNYTRTCD